ncbi:MAG: SDR family NAD(P)-dependent oxidoreductase [Aquabacterium sp.]
MDIQAGQIAVITGGGTGMGRALCRQLSAQGVHVALCDVSADAMAATRELCLASAPAGTRVTTCVADVSQEAAVLAFKAAVIAEHQTDHIHLLFNNAGIGGGGGFVAGDRRDWERTFGVDWFGVYYGARAFMPMLVASPVGCIVNVASVNGFWARLGPGVPHTAYSAAKFAVKGFTEALIIDLRENAPHVSCAVVMPGHIGTSIALNTYDAMKMTTAQVALVRGRMVKAGAPVAQLPDDAIRQLMHQRAIDFRDSAPTTAEQAATIILDGVRAGHWRILVGEDAQLLDRMVRERPEQAYDEAFMAEWQAAKPPPARPS